MLEVLGYQQISRIILGGIGVYLLARFIYLITFKKKFTVDLLMSFVAITTYYYELTLEGLVLMTLYAIAETTESLVERYAESKLVGLIRIIPEKVLVEKGGTAVLVDARKVKPGSVVLVRRGEAVPLDGILLNDGVFDTSIVTGESLPVKISKGGLVESGYINLGDPIRVKVMKPFGDSLLQVIVSKAREALEAKSRREKLVNRLSPHISFLTLAGFFAALYLGGPYKALPILFAGCPSAFIVASSYSTSLTIASLASKGVVVRGGVVLEKASEASVVALDKTGTITTGVPRVSRIVTVPDVRNKEELAFYIASAASASRHPISVALSTMSSKKMVPSKALEKPGMGLEALVNGRRVLIGSKEYMKLNKVDISQLEGACRAHEGVVYAHIDGVTAALCLEEEVSKDVAEAVSELKKRFKVVVMSGDSGARVSAICKKLGVDECYYELRPDDKLALVDKLRKKYGQVVMVGDGINDVEALAAADVGVAMGNIEAVTSVADATLTQGLRQLPQLLESSKSFIGGLKLAFIVAFAVKAYAAVSGVLEALPLLVIAFIADDGSTLASVASSTLVLRKHLPKPRFNLKNQR